MAAKERWKMLRTVLLEKRTTNDAPIYKALDPSKTSSVRRFSSFELFSVSSSRSTSVLNQQQSAVDSAVTAACCNDVTWTRYSYTYSNDADQDDLACSTCNDLAVEIALLSSAFSLEDLQGFNNTGNVCIWPSEEVMTYYCLQRRKEFKGLSVCELGAGMTGLAGIFLSKTSLPKEVVITDGNEKSVRNLQLIINHNQLSTNSLPVKAEVVVWENTDLSDTYENLRERFDVVLCADCLFFTDVHEGLISLLNHLLKPSTGKVIMFAPLRNGTLTVFRDLAEKYFDIETSDDYLSVVSRKHALFLNDSCKYDQDIHYPLMLTLKRIKNNY